MDNWFKEDTMSRITTYQLKDVYPRHSVCIQTKMIYFPRSARVKSYQLLNIL